MLRCRRYRKCGVNGDVRVSSLECLQTFLSASRRR